MIRREIVPVTCDGAGAATVFSRRLSGKVNSISYIKNNFANGVDFAITAEATGEGIWSESDVNASTVRAPRMAIHSVAGVASLFAAGGTAVQDKIALGADRIKIVIAQGGAGTLGAFHILMED